MADRVLYIFEKCKKYRVRVRVEVNKCTLLKIFVLQNSHFYGLQVLAFQAVNKCRKYKDQKTKNKKGRNCNFYGLSGSVEGVLLVG